LVNGVGLYLITGEEEVELAANLVLGIFPCWLDALTEKANWLNPSWLFLFKTGKLLQKPRLRVREEILNFLKRGVVPDIGQLLQGPDSEHKL
jgi:hypothetical protein